jgi:hypothetical protein
MVMLGAVVLLLGGMAQARADSMAFSTGTGTGNQSWTGNLGLDFNVTSPITVTALGAYDSGKDGFAGPITVGLYSRVPGGDPNQDTSGNLLTSLTLNGTQGTLVGNYRFMSLGSPLVLQPGFYSIVAVGFSTADKNGNETLAGFSQTSNDIPGLLSIVGSGRYDTSSILDYPSTTSFNQGFPQASGHVFGAGNFEFQSAPEPASLTLLGLGALGLAGYAVRRRRKAIATN